MPDIVKKVLAIVFAVLIIAIAFLLVRSLFVWLEVDIDYGSIFGLIVIAVVLGIFTRFFRVE